MMINGIIEAMRRFEKIRFEQATSQSDHDPWYTHPSVPDRSVAPLQGPANAQRSERRSSSCSCHTQNGVCKDCVDEQMILNQAI